MTIQDWGAIGEIVGALAIIATLIYFSVQMKQAAALMKSSAAAIGTDTYTQVWQIFLTRPELSTSWQKGAAGVENLSDLEAKQYFIFLGTALRSFEQYYFLNTLDALPDEYWEGWHNVLRDLAITQGFQEVWPGIKHHYAKSFQTVVDLS